MRFTVHKLITLCGFIFSFSTMFLSAKENRVEQYSLDNGIPFYYLQNTDNSIDAIIICVKGNTFQISREYSGIEEVLFDVMALGSTKYDSAYVKKYEYETGTRIGSKSEPDFSLLTMESPTDNFEDALPVFLSCFTSPAFDYSDFLKVRNEKLKALSNSLENPSSALSFYTSELLSNRQYSYGNSFMTPISSSNISLRTIYSHYNSILDAKRISVVAVSQKPADQIYKELNRQLGQISESEKKIRNRPSAQQTPELKGNMIFTHQKAENSGYASRILKYPSTDTAEAFALSVAELIYTDILKSVLCEKYEICSSAFSTHSNLLPEFGYMTFLNCTDFENLKKYESEARSYLMNRKIISSTTDNGEFLFEPVENVIEGYKNSCITSFYSKNITTLGTAINILDSIIYQNSLDFQNLAITKIRNLTADDVINAFSKYCSADEDFWICIVSPEIEEQVEKAFNF